LPFWICTTAIDLPTLTPRSSNLMPKGHHIGSCDGVAHLLRDLEMMGEAVTKADTGIEKLHFSFEKRGDFAAPREIQWLTRRKRDEVRKSRRAEAAE
jgi:hypothetical protein